MLAGREEGQCPDRWERFSSSISSLSMSLLPTLLFVLVMAYVIVVGLQNATITFTVQGKEVTVTYPKVSAPVDYSAIKTTVFLLFGAIVLGIFVPLIPDEKRSLKALVGLIQAAVFVYGLYVFVMAIVNFASSMV